jgi:hypothetical protein
VHQFRALYKWFVQSAMNCGHDQFHYKDVTIFFRSKVWVSYVCDLKQVCENIFSIIIDVCVYVRVRTLYALNNRLLNVDVNYFREMNERVSSEAWLYVHLGSIGSQFEITRRTLSLFRCGISIRIVRRGASWSKARLSLHFSRRLIGRQAWWTSWGRT